MESVEIDGKSALAEFDNGNQVRFEQDSDGAVWKVVETPQAASSGSDEVIQPE